MSRASATSPAWIYGPEPWKTLRGLELSHWDLWFVVAVSETFGGKRGVVEAIKARSRRYGSVDKRDLEAKLSHLLDLETRLLAAGLTHADVLAEVTVDYGLRRKALTKVLDQEVSHPMPAMVETPRKVLRERAMRGYWPGFPVNPAEYETAFARARGSPGVYNDYRGTPVVARGLECACELALANARSPGERLAASRAMMTTTLEIMESVDDSDGCMRPLFKAVLRGYLAAVWESGFDPEVALRDSIEFGIWEDYGLSDEMDSFLQSAPPEFGDLAVRVFEETTAELFIHGLEYEYAKAHSMWATLLVAQGRIDEFEFVARRVGADAFVPIATMAKAAWSAGRRDVTRAVFAAANRPGFQRGRLREACVQLTGEEPLAREPALRLVQGGLW